MTQMNDNDFLDQLESDFADHLSDVRLRDGIADEARRRARRRTATRAIGAGAPALAAAGVAVVLATSGGSGGPGGSGGSGGSAPAASAGPAKAVDTAYVVRRVKAKIADDAQEGNLATFTEYQTGDVGSDGTVSNLGSPVGAPAWRYESPDGTYYLRGTDAGEDDYTQEGETPNGQEYVDQTKVNNVDHTYETRRIDLGVKDSASANDQLTFASSPAQIQQAVNDGHSEIGTTTLDGTSVITLTVTDPQNEGRFVLYVDATTYQPLREIHDYSHSTDPSIQHVIQVVDVQPMTPENIAKTKVSIPAGYTQADWPQPAAGQPRH